MKTLLIRGITLCLGENENVLANKISETLRIATSEIKDIEIIKKAIDARRNKPPQFVYVLKTTIDSKEGLPDSPHQKIQWMEMTDFPEAPLLSSVNPPDLPVVVIGSGPAGLFAAYILSLRGIPPILLERGSPVERRVRDVEKFWNEGTLNRQSNVLFGEGGAGTFSDGKLTSRSKNPFSLWVKNILVEMGAPPEIITDAKPHIGSDKLRCVLMNMRNRLKDMRCRIEFDAQVTDFLIKRGAITALIVNNKDEIKTSGVILAIGQHADDTYKKLYERGIRMEAKPFAMGLRVEHPQELINAIQYGKWHHHHQLPPAEYFLRALSPDSNRSVYTFCMCPGGSVIGCSSFRGTLITNGMSHYRRSGEFANSAIVVNIRTDDFASENMPLNGLYFRREWEQKAFVDGGRNYRAPAQKITDFMECRSSGRVGKSSYLPGIEKADLRRILPGFVAESIRHGISNFNKQMYGFITEESHLIGVETRTSSPVRICRRKDGQVLNIKGLYPCGEGAGYAGGIISSALDGIKAAQHLIDQLAHQD